MLKRKEQVDKSTGNTSNARGGRGGRGGAVARGGGRTVTRSYQSGMQTVSFPPSHKNVLFNMTISRIVTCLFTLSVC